MKTTSIGSAFYPKLMCKFLVKINNFPISFHYIFYQQQWLFERFFFKKLKARGGYYNLHISMATWIFSLKNIQYIQPRQNKDAKIENRKE